MDYSVRVVFDTSVLVAAARSRRGASNALLSLLPDPRFQPAVSVPVFVEYQAVLLRPENLLQRPAALAEAFLDFLLSVSHLQEIFFLWRPTLPDPDDDLILELAVAAEVDILLLTMFAISEDRKNWESRQ
jgi:putative PIN family toxin of toxin-antitoxin system